MPNDKLAILADLIRAFPKLTLAAFDKIGDATDNYNCIAWAAGDTTAWWEPGLPDGYWPDGVVEEFTLSAYMQAYGTLGYVPCDSEEIEPGYEKVAIYYEERQTYACFQTIAGWTMDQ